MDENNNINETTQDAAKETIEETINETPSDKPATYDRPSAFDNPTSEKEASESSASDTPAGSAPAAGAFQETENRQSYGNTYGSNQSYNEGNTIISGPEAVSTGYGIASLVLGILSIPCSCCYGAGLLFSILGIIFGCVQPKDYDGKKPAMAVAGIICSIVGILFAIITVALFVLAAFSA